MLDPDTKQAYQATEYECRELGADPANPPTLYRAPPESAMGEGYRGRSGIYELVAIDDEMRTMIHDGAGEHETRAPRQKRAVEAFVKTGCARSWMAGHPSKKFYA